jgi:uncharacterized protein (TIGR02246 family)
LEPVEWDIAFRSSFCRVVEEDWIAGLAMHQSSSLLDLARRYTEAWCSQDPQRVASFYEENGSLTVNRGVPAVGREAIEAVARGFMSAFPDMKVFMDDLVVKDNDTRYHWTLTGTNTGPGGTGRPVRISGFESWHVGPTGLIKRSQGHFDENEYNRQLGG